MNQLAALGWQEILLFLLILMLFFGARKLPELARSLGSSVSEFKKGLKESDNPPTDATQRKTEKNDTLNGSN